VDNSRLVVAVMLSLCLAFVVGCGDTASSEADAKVVAAVQRAERLCDRAQTIMAEVPFLIGDEMAPLFTPSEASAVIGSFDVTKMNELNPKAVAALEEARSVLKAVQDESDAPALTQALAASAMARVRVLQGLGEAYNAARARRKVAAAGVVVNELVLRAAAELSVVDYVDGLAGSKAGSTGQTAREKIAELVERAKVEISRCDDAVGIAEADLVKQTDARDALVKKTTGFRAELSAFEQGKTQAKGEDKVALILQIEAKQIELDKALHATAVAEAAMVDARGVLQRRRAFQEAAKVTLTTLNTMGTMRQVEVGKLAEKRTEAVGSVTKTQGRLEAEVKTLAAAWADVARFEAAAQVCFDDAAKHLDRALLVARKVSGADGKGMLVMAGSAQGRAYLSSAELDTASLLRQRANVKLAESVQRQWREIAQRQGADESVPAELKASLESMVAFPPSVDVASKRKAAAAKFDKAKGAFAAAVRNQVPNLRWADRGQLAYATYMYAVYARDSLSIRAAQQEILDVLSTTRESPFVKSLLEYEKMLTFGALTFATVTGVSPEGELVLAEGADNGTYVKSFDDGRTTKDLPGAVYFVGAKIDLQGETYEPGKILLRVADGQYLAAPEGLKLNVPVDMTINGKPYKANANYPVP